MRAAVLKMDEYRNPQTEDGYSRIANELFDAILAFPFTARQQKIVWAIVRKTYGFNKKADDIGSGMLAKMTGLHDPHVRAAVRELAEMNVITRTPGSYGQVLGINKRYSEWGGADRNSPAEGGPKQSALPDQNSPPPRTKTVRKGGPKQSDSKDNPKRQPQKTTPKDIPHPGGCGAQYRTKKGRTLAGPLLASFDRFWLAFDHKTGKAEAADEWLKLGPDDELAAQIIAAAEREAARRPALVLKGGTPKMAQGWLSGRRFEDEIEPDGDANEQQIVDAYNTAFVCAPEVREITPNRRGMIAWHRRKRPGFDWPRFFSWAAELPALNGENDGGFVATFDWLMNPNNFAKVLEGQRDDR